MRWWKTYRVLTDMRERLRWSPEEIRRYRLWKLRELVQLTYFNSPFYRQFYDQHGVHPDQIETEDDLKRLPLLEKESLQQADPLQVVTIRADAAAAEKPDWLVEVTSGSTGLPLKIYRTWRDLYFIKAKVIRAFGQTGFRFYHRQVVLKSSTESLTGQHWFEKFGILRKYWLSVTDPPGYNLRRLQEIRPQHLHGYPSGLLSIAELLQERSQTFHIPVICTGAEVLDQSMRRDIGEAFKAEVFDLYAVREVGNIAWECQAHQGMHINEDAMIVELLDENGDEVPPGAQGEVVVTYLDGLDYPFIRYRLGDRAVRLGGDCSCGVHFSRLESILGRSDERILLPSGEWISGLVFQELRTAPWISAFRIIQSDLDSIELQVVPKSTFQPGELEALVERTKDLVRGELNVVPQVLSRLVYDDSGKMRAVICKLPLKDDDVSSAPAEDE